MIDRENRASARLPAAPNRLERGKGLAKALADVPRSIYHWLERIVSRLASVQARRTALRNLYALDDRLLHDIGLRRDQVAEVVEGMFRGQDVETPTPAAPVVQTAAGEADVDNERHYKSAA